MLLVFTFLHLLTSIHALNADRYGTDQQKVLQSATRGGGVLRRYEVTEDVSQWVQRRDLDVWFRNSSHMDIYFPNTYSYSEASILPQLPNLIFSIPIDVSSSYLRPQVPAMSWNMTSLVDCVFHDTYHPLFEIDLFLQRLEREYPGLVKVHHIGHTAEGREMHAIRIVRKETKKNGKPKKKQAIVIQGAQHSREWIATATALYLAHSLVVDKSEAGSTNALLKKFDFYFIPVPNPDGYEYTWSYDRLWYKNRMLLDPEHPCRGLDMNRNWGFKWLPDGDDFEEDICSHWYPGSKPFEAPETMHLAKYIGSRPRVEAFLDLRNYGQMISMPFSYSCDVMPAHAEDLLEAAIGAAQALRKVHGTHMTTGSLCEMLYPAPGNIVDWMYSVGGIRYSYAVHLRDTGTYGFMLPDKMIRPTGEETAAMLKYFTHFISLR